MAAPATSGVRVCVAHVPLRRLAAWTVIAGITVAGGITLRLSSVWTVAGASCAATVALPGAVSRGVVPLRSDRRRPPARHAPAAPRTCGSQPLVEQCCAAVPARRTQLTRVADVNGIGRRQQCLACCCAPRGDSAEGSGRARPTDNGWKWLAHMWLGRCGHHCEPLAHQVACQVSQRCCHSDRMAAPLGPSCHSRLHIRSCL